MSHRTRVLILQHPEEARHPLNTARLALLGLRQAELWVGEDFAELDGVIASVEHALLLFPAPPDSSTPAVPEAQELDGAELLIVPDGTWRQARRIVQANPLLATLPRLSLPPGLPSEYRVRRALEPAAVSTIEAIVRALTQLESGQDFQPLLAPFHALIDQQIQAMGEEVYRRHHILREGRGHE